MGTGACQIRRPQAGASSTDLVWRCSSGRVVGWLGHVDEISSWPVVGVVGGCGGAGASTFAAVLAAMAALGGRSVLVDLDPVAGGIDVLVGLEGVPGARWSGLLLGGGRLDPVVLVDGLPWWSSVAVLSADMLPEPDAVSQVMGAACQAGPVVVDLGRWDSPARTAAVLRCTITVLVCGADVRSVTGGRVVRAALGDRPLGVVVSRSRGGIAPVRRVAELVDAPLIGVVRARRRRGDVPLDARSLPRPMARVAQGVLDAVRQPGSEVA
jgi:secretion/DNA translocation related CpaE-like protein